MLAGALAGLLLAAGGAHAQERMRSFVARYDIQPDGSVVVEEFITWDFGDEEHHGIFRDLVDHRACEDRQQPPGSVSQQPLYECPDGSDRQWPLEITDVEAARAPVASESPSYAPAQYETSEVGDGIQVKIGDPDETVTGAWLYHIRYVQRGMLDAYDDHDELYWNALGTWPVPIDSVQITVSLPQQTTLQTACYEGFHSNASCKVQPGRRSAVYSATRTMFPNEEVSIVLGWEKGLVTVGPPITEDRISPDDFFSLDAIEFGGLLLVGIAGLGAVLGLWWRNGRDRRYRTLYYLTNDPSEQTKPLFAHTDVVVEYLPPDDLRPAQMGLILDESADTLDVTATVVDLAVRGYLHITEIPKEGLFGKKDWKLTKAQPAPGRDTSELMPYERTIYDGLFRTGDDVELSDLKNHFVNDLNKAEEQLYTDAVRRKWFTKSPAWQRGMWIGIGIATAVIGVGLCVAAGWFWARTLIFVPVIVAGLILLVFSKMMSRRTAVGSEALRRVLGFRLYVATAETRMQEFNEQQNIFARYLPYAIVFRCVDKWAKAFSHIDDPEAMGTTGWYTGVGAFHAAAFSSSLQGFAGSVSSTISSSPGSGGSGFSGGFSGGGGGGGGGGSW